MIERVDRSWTSPAKTSEIIARAVADQIIEEDLEPGARLPPEREMVENFGVGRSTLREALRLLETRGVISIKRGPGGGPVVRRPGPEDLSESLSLLLQFREASLMDVLDARRALEPMAARLASERVDAETLSELQDTIDLMRDSKGDSRSFSRQNWLFHRLISKAASSTILQIFIDSLQALWDGASIGVEYDEYRQTRTADAHQRIVDALAQNDPSHAERAMHEHLDEATHYWTKYYEHLMAQRLRWTR